MSKPTKRDWPFLGWMSIREMQEHIEQLRAEIERLDARLERPRRKLKKQREHQ